MSLLTRIFRRTPSLRQRVGFTSAMAGAIVVVIAGTVVWFGITDAWNERLDRRLDEAAGFAIPFLPRGLDEIPKSPNNQDAVITVRKDGQVASNSTVILPHLEPGYADTYVDGVRYRVRTVDIRAPEQMSVAVGATYDATIADINNLHRRVIVICTLAIGAATVGDGCLPHSRFARSNVWPSRPGRSTPATRIPTSTSVAPRRPSRSPRR